MSESLSGVSVVPTVGSVKTALGFDKRVESNLNMFVDAIAARVNVIANAQGIELNRLAEEWAQLVEAIDRGVSGRELDELIIAMAATQGIEITLEQLVAGTPESVAFAFERVAEELGGFLDPLLPHSFPLEGLLKKLTDLLLNPPRVPGEPCLAPTPLLRDLLDLALGRVTGAIGATLNKVKQTASDLLFPAFAKGEELARSVQAVLADPITAALNLVLGHRGQIDCEVEAGLGVGAGVIETQIRRLEGALAEALA